MREAAVGAARAPPLLEIEAVAAAVGRERAAAGAAAGVALRAVLGHVAGLAADVAVRAAWAAGIIFAPGRGLNPQARELQTEFSLVLENIWRRENGKESSIGGQPAG